eukprot:6385383-Amphidinium_carterae.2
MQFNLSWFRVHHEATERISPILHLPDHMLYGHLQQCHTMGQEKSKNAQSQCHTPLRSQSSACRTCDTSRGALACVRRRPEPASCFCSKYTKGPWQQYMRMRSVKTETDCVTEEPSGQNSEEASGQKFNLSTSQGNSSNSQCASHVGPT